MKYKNYKSAIHNFAHSFMSIDYMKSGRLAENVLIYLHNKGLETIATFDFIGQSIQPIVEAISKDSKKLHPATKKFTYLAGVRCKSLLN